MLTYLLAWVMAFGSFGLYLTAFFFPELHRKNDLIFSGVGLFFALTLFIYAERLRGGLLLGETAAVALILWFGWQSLSYRRQLTNPKLKTDATEAEKLWQSLKALLPGQASSEDGVPSSKIATQISEWVSKVDLEKLKGQFQGVLPKMPSPANQSTPAVEPEPKNNDLNDLEEFESTVSEPTSEAPAEITETVNKAAEEFIASPESDETVTTSIGDSSTSTSDTEPPAIEVISEEVVELAAASLDSPQPEADASEDIETLAPEFFPKTESPASDELDMTSEQSNFASPEAEDEPIPTAEPDFGEPEMPEPTNEPVPDTESGHTSEDDNWPPPDPVN